MNDECSGCSLLERNLYQYGVHAKIIVFCKTYNTVHGVPEVHGMHGAQWTFLRVKSLHDECSGCSLLERIYISMEYMQNL